jgi:hypothetical protein
MISIGLANIIGILIYIYFYNLFYIKSIKKGPWFSALVVNGSLIRTPIVDLAGGMS